MLKNALTLFALAAILLIVFLPSYAKMQDLKMKNREMAQRIDQLEKKNAKLSEEKRMLETDPEYLEKVAREKMGLIRDGEKVYKIVPAQKSK